ncbi:four helix bundle protein [Pirellulales bacterium]|nr:four helix bundle protein [Pirellulales bacterium]
MNISEAWKKRRYPNSFVSKLSDADTEAGEVQSWLDSAIDSGYISQQQFDEFDDLYSHIGAQLNRMMDRPDQWCTRLAEGRKQNVGGRDP